MVLLINPTPAYIITTIPETNSRSLEDPVLVSSSNFFVMTTKIGTSHSPTFKEEVFL